MKKNILFLALPLSFLFKAQPIYAENSDIDISFSQPITAFEQTKDLDKATMYCLHDTVDLADANLISAQISDLPIGTKVLIVGEEGDFYVTHQMTYIQKEVLTENEEDVWYPCDEIKYVKEDNENFSFNTELHLVARNCKDVYRTEDGKTIEKANLMDDKYIPPVEKKELAPIGYEHPEARLTPSAGAIIDAWGQRESYYNLDMSTCISIMRSMGNSDPYWIRSDGAKMLGNYVMCAANLNLHPRGSLVPSSLGTAIVVDTGTFIYTYPNGLDLCVAW